MSLLALAPENTPVSRQPIGIYVHFPWCLKKCPYCDFLSIAADRQDIPAERYTRQVVNELVQRADGVEGREVASVFVGGGTPSLWGANGIAAFLEALRDRFSLVETEISVECNPTSFSRELGDSLAEAGVTRISLGVQGLQDDRLRFLGRLHDARGALAAVRDAVACDVPATSADLIFGVHGQTAAEAADEVATVADLGVQHLSAYALTIEPGTQFGALHRRGRLPLLPEETAADCFRAVRSALRARGFEHYEISNYAKPGHHARHNVGYWRGRDYVGLGCGAWGTLSDEQGAFRYRNTVSIDRYMALEHWPIPSEVTAGPGQPHQDFERLDVEARLLERLMLGLRLAEGIHVPSMLASLGLETLGERRQRRLLELKTRGQVEWDGETLAIPAAQWLFADGIIARLA